MRTCLSSKQKSKRCSESDFPNIQQLHLKLVISLSENSNFEFVILMLYCSRTVIRSFVNSVYIQVKALRKALALPFVQAHLINARATTKTIG